VKAKASTVALLRRSSDEFLHSVVEPGATLVHLFPAVLKCIGMIAGTQTQNPLVVDYADLKLTFIDPKERIVTQMNHNSTATAISAIDFDRDGFAELVIVLKDSSQPCADCCPESSFFAAARFQCFKHCNWSILCFGHGFGARGNRLHRA
jgi:hypothetical protein